MSFILTLTPAELSWLRMAVARQMKRVAVIEKKFGADLAAHVVERNAIARAVAAKVTK